MERGAVSDWKGPDEGGFTLVFPDATHGKEPVLRRRTWLGAPGTRPAEFEDSYYVAGGPRVIVAERPGLWAPSSCHVLGNESINHRSPVEAWECWNYRCQRFGLAQWVRPVPE